MFNLSYKIKFIKDQYRIKAYKKMDDDFIIIKIRHISSLLEKVVKNNYQKNRGKYKAKLLNKLINEAIRRNTINEKNVILWGKDVLYRYNKWEKNKNKILNIIESDKTSEMMTIRFWKNKNIDIKIIRKIINEALKAPASCNRQPFKIVIEKNRNVYNISEKNVTNESLLKHCPITISIYCDERFYLEKHAAALDVGILAQEINKIAWTSYGLSTCFIYAYETYKYNYLKKKFNINKTSKCYLKILMGYPLEYANKPSRRNLNNVLLYKKTIS